MRCGREGVCRRAVAPGVPRRERGRRGGRAARAGAGGGCGARRRGPEGARPGDAGQASEGLPHARGAARDGGRTGLVAEHRPQGHLDRDRGRRPRLPRRLRRRVRAPVPPDRSRGSDPADVGGHDAEPAAGCLPHPPALRPRHRLREHPCARALRRAAAAAARAGPRVRSRQPRSAARRAAAGSPGAAGHQPREPDPGHGGDDGAPLRGVRNRPQRPHARQRRARPAHALRAARHRAAGGLERPDEGTRLPACRRGSSTRTTP